MTIKPATIVTGALGIICLGIASLILAINWFGSDAGWSAPWQPYVIATPFLLIGIGFIAKARRSYHEDPER